MNPIDPVLFAQVLRDYVSGRLTEPQKAEVEQIVGHSGELQRLLGEFHDPEQVARQVELAASFDVERALQRMRSVRHRRLSLTITEIAVAILLPLVLLSIYYFEFRDEAEQPATAARVETQGSANTPVLRLGSGEVISLDTVGGRLDLGQNILDNHDGVIRIGEGESPDPRSAVMHTIEVPCMQTCRIRLPDGTGVRLNSGSSLTFPASFGSGERRVTLSGEAYFEVAASTTQRFVVAVGGMDIGVMGTSFNVRAYGNGRSVRTTLVEGSVCVTNGYGTQKTLCPGEQAVAELSSGDIGVRKVDTALYTAWMNGQFYFQNTPLEEIMDAIGQWYALKLVYLDKELKAEHYSARIKQYGSVEDVLRKFEKSEHLRFQLHSGAIFISKTDSRIGSPGS